MLYGKVLFFFIKCAGHHLVLHVLTHSFPTRRSYELGKPADFSAMEDQMRVTYANAARILARFGATLDHVVEETLYVLDVEAAFAVAGKVRKEAYSKIGRVHV